MADFELSVGVNSSDAEVGLRRLAESIRNTSAGGSNFRGIVDAIGQTIRAFTLNINGLGLAMRALNASLGLVGAGLAAWKMQQFITDSTMLAARFQTLGVILGSVGKNIGYTQAQMMYLAKGVELTGITMQESRQTIVSLAQANIDLSKATKLARVAQDAAVIGQTNSSDALQRMTYGIKTAQIEVLRTIGINVQFEAGYARMAQSLGKASSALSETEKAASRTNTVLEAGKRIAGTYEASMSTAGKQLGSMARYVDDLKTKLGQIFLPAFTSAVFSTVAILKGLNKTLDANSGAISAIGNTLAGLLSMLPTLTGAFLALAGVRGILALVASQRAAIAGFNAMSIASGRFAAVSMVMGTAMRGLGAMIGGLYTAMGGWIGILLIAAGALAGYVWQSNAARDAVIDNGKRLREQKEAMLLNAAATDKMTKAQKDHARAEYEMQLFSSQKALKDSASATEGNFFNNFFGSDTKLAMVMPAFGSAGAQTVAQNKAFIEINAKFSEALKLSASGSVGASSAISKAMQVVVDATNDPALKEAGGENLYNIYNALFTLASSAADVDKLRLSISGLNGELSNLPGAVTNWQDFAGQWQDTMNALNLQVVDGVLTPEGEAKSAGRAKSVGQAFDSIASAMGSAQRKAKMGETLTQPDKDAIDYGQQFYRTHPRAIREQIQGIADHQAKTPAEKAQEALNIKIRTDKFSPAMRPVEQAYEETYASVFGATKDGPRAEAEALIAKNRALHDLNLSISDNNRLTATQLDGAAKLAIASEQGSAQAIRQSLENKAIEQSLDGRISASQALAVETEKFRLAEINTINEKINTTKQEIAGNTALAAAWEQGAAAAKKQEFANQAVAETSKLAAVDSIAAAIARERLIEVYSGSAASKAIVSTLEQRDALKLEAEASARMTAAAGQGEAATIAATLANQAKADSDKLAAAGVDIHEKSAAELLKTMNALRASMAADKAVTSALNDSYDLGKQADKAKLTLSLMNETEAVRERSLKLYDLQIKRQEQLNTAEKTLTGTDLTTATNQINKAYNDSVRFTGAIQDADEAQKEAAKSRELWLEPFKTAISSIQGQFTTLFEGIFNGGVDTFKKFADSVKNVFIRLAAEIASLMVVRPVFQAVLGGTALGSSMGFSSSGGGLFSGVTSAASQSQASGSVGGVGGGGMFSGVTSMFSQGGALQPGQWNTGFGSMLFGNAGTTLGAMGKGGGGVSSQVVGASSGLFGSGGGGGFGSFLNSPIGGGMASGLMAGITEYASGGSLGTSLGAGIGGTIGGIAGSYFGPLGTMAGSMIGSMLGKMVGGLFGKKKKTKKGKAYTSNILDFSDYGVDALDATGRTKGNLKMTADLGAANKMSNDITDAFNEFMDASGFSISPDAYGSIDTLTKSKKSKKGKVKTSTSYSATFGGVNLGSTASAEELLSMLISGSLAVGGEQGSVSGVGKYTGDIFKNAFADNDRQGITDKDELTKMAEFGQFMDRVERLNTPAQAAAKALKDLNAEMNKAKRSAVEYGIAVADVTAVFKKNFEEDIASQLLQLTDPSAYALGEFEKTAAARVAMATELGANLVDVEKLNAIERQKVVEEGLNGLNSQFRDFFDSLMLGELSTLTPEQQYAQAQGRYTDVMASGSKDGFVEAAQNLLEAARVMFASSEQYSTIFNQVVGDTRVLGNIQGFANGGVAKGTVLVGERGPELVNLGSSSSVVNAKMAGNLLKMYGLGGDNMVAHINSQEAALLMENGGSGTINPHTGLREFKYGGRGTTEGRGTRGTGPRDRSGPRGSSGTRGRPEAAGHHGGPKSGWGGGNRSNAANSDSAKQNRDAVSKHAGRSTLEKIGWGILDFLAGPLWNGPATLPNGRLDTTVPGSTTGGTWHGTYNETGVYGAIAGGIAGGIAGVVGGSIVGGFVGSQFGPETSWGDPNGWGGSLGNVNSGSSSMGGQTGGTGSTSTGSTSTRSSDGSTSSMGGLYDGGGGSGGYGGGGGGGGDNNGLLKALANIEKALPAVMASGGTNPNTNSTGSGMGGITDAINTTGSSTLGALTQVVSQLVSLQEAITMQLALNKVTR